ncbi:MAG: SH3 domain-containing protein [Bacteroidales bacterium]|nr:SH3 domain-containing protein [Bacteroidales bacterium]
MNPILLKQRITKWIEACQFLKSAEIKEQLDTDEWTAIEELSNLWNKNFTANGVKDDALAHIDTLKRCEDMHPNNLKIKEMSKALTGVAREMMTKDEATYNEFKEALKKEIKQNRPVPKAPPTPKVTPTVKPKVPATPKTPVIPKTPPRTTVSDRDIKIVTVENRNVDYDGNVIDDFGSKLKVGSLYISSRLHIATSYVGEAVIETRFVDPDGKERGSTSTKFDINGSGNYRTISYGNDNGNYWNKPGYWTLKYYINGREAHTHKLYIYPKDNKITIEKVLFGNSDEQSNIIDDYGSTLYTNTKYLRPKITFSTARRGNTKFEIKITSPSGKVSTYDTTINITQDSETWNLTGWGNDQGTFYTAGQWKVQFYVDNVLLRTETVTIHSRTTPRPPVTPRNTGGGGGGNSGKGFVNFLKWAVIIGTVLFALNYFSRMDCSGRSDLPVEYAIADGVKLYQQPKLNSVVNQKLNRGTKLYLVEREGDTGWIKVETDDGTKGYIHESYTLSEEMHTNISKLFANSDPAVVDKFQRMKYQVMKNQALADVYRFAPGFMTVNAKIVDVDTAADKPYEQVAFLITDGTSTFAVAYSFNADGEPKVTRYSALHEKRNDTYFTAISLFTAYQLKVKTSDGKTVTVDIFK